MTNTRLTWLTLLHVHRDIPIDLEAALDKFARLYHRLYGLYSTGEWIGNARAPLTASKTQLQPA